MQSGRGEGGTGISRVISCRSSGQVRNSRERNQSSLIEDGILNCPPRCNR